MRKSNIPAEKLLPFEIIEAATKGDLDALAAVLNHFEGYIASRSTRIFYDEFGRSYHCVDQELKQRIENKLTARIIQKFKAV